MVNIEWLKTQVDLNNIKNLHRLGTFELNPRTGTCPDHGVSMRKVGELNDDMMDSEVYRCPICGHWIADWRGVTYHTDEVPSYMSPM